MPWPCPRYVKDAFEEGLSGLEWMKAETKLKAKSKSKAVLPL